MQTHHLMYDCTSCRRTMMSDENLFKILNECKSSIEATALSSPQHHKTSELTNFQSEIQTENHIKLITFALIY